MQRIDRHIIDRRIRRALPRPTYHLAKGVYYQARTLARRNPGRGRLLPDFLIIGSTKCGTTSLHGWLTQHPLIAETKKETHFFNIHYYLGPDWYRCYFPREAKRDAFADRHGRPFLVGEATASYMSHYWAPRRAAKLLPNARLIVSLRDPVDRAYSEFHYMRRQGHEPLESFEQAVDTEDDRLREERARQRRDRHYHSWPLHCWSYLEKGRYAEQLKRWFEQFPREQFLFLKFDTEVMAAPARALERIHAHLGLPAHDASALPTLNAGEYEPMTSATRERLTEYFRPHNARLRELTGIDFGWPA